MNILFYYEKGFDPLSGGVERISCSVAEALKEKSHNVFFVTFKPYDKITDFEKKYNIKKLILPDNNHYSSNENIEIFSDFIISENIDVIISQSSDRWQAAELPALVKKRTKIKLIYVIHSSPNFLEKAATYRGISLLPSRRKFNHYFIRNQALRVLGKTLRYYFKRKFGNLYLKESQSADALVVLSESYIPIIYRMNKQIKKNKNIYAIPNINTYPNLPLNLEEKENLIIFIARLSNEKHPEKAMWVWKNLQNEFPNWNFKLLGAGSEVMENDLKTLKEKWNLQRFSLEGKQDPKSYYQKAKILFLLSDFEGFGMVLTEAMQHGVVPISFNSSEVISDIINDKKDGEIIDNYNLQEFIDRTKRLMSDSEKLNQKAILAHQSSNKFSSENIIKQWDDLLRKITL